MALPSLFRAFPISSPPYPRRPAAVPVLRRRAPLVGALWVLSLGTVAALAYRTGCAQSHRRFFPFLRWIPLSLIDDFLTPFPLSRNFCTNHEKWQESRVKVWNFGTRIGVGDHGFQYFLSVILSDDLILVHYFDFMALILWVISLQWSFKLEGNYSFFTLVNPSTVCFRMFWSWTWWLERLKFMEWTSWIYWGWFWVLESAEEDFFFFSVLWISDVMFLKKCMRSSGFDWDPTVGISFFLKLTVRWLNFNVGEWFQKIK